MSPALAHFLTRLHSSQWKSRYAPEFEALLIDMPATPATILDVARSVFATQRRLVAAGFLLIAIAALPFHETKQNANVMRIATRSSIERIAKCRGYTSIQRSAHGRCVLG